MLWPGARFWGSILGNSLVPILPAGQILGVRSLLLLFLTMGTREIIFQDGFEAVMNINKQDLTPGFPGE